MTTEEQAALDAAAPAAPDAAALQTQIAELKEQVAEEQRTAEFWAQKAKANTPAAPAAAATEVEDDTDVLEALTTGGTKGFDALANKRGFIKRDEVQALIDAKAGSLSKEQELIQEYPDLKKKDSDFFKATAFTYGELVKGGTPQPIAMEMAARQTELKFLREGKMKLPGAEPTKAEKEAERLARVAAQSGENGRRAPAGGDEDTELDAQQLHVVRSMLVGQPGTDGKPMNEAQAIERYKARAKGGVAMRGSR